MEEKNNTDTDINLGRGFRQKRPTHIAKDNEKDNISDSSKNEESDNDSIPELNKTLRVQDNQNIEKDTYIENIDNIPIVIAQDDSNVSIDNHNITNIDSLLKNVVEIKMLCKRIDKRLNLLENNHMIKSYDVNIHHNIDMLPQLPMNIIEDINNFEVVLVSEEAQSQLINMLLLIGGTSIKDAMKRTLQKLFTNNLASKCSWTGAKNNFKLKDLKIIACMQTSLKKIFPTLTESEFEETLKTWFRQANLRLIRENARNAINNI